MALTRQLGHREPHVIMKQNPAHEATSGLKAWRLLLSGWCLSCKKKKSVISPKRQTYIYIKHYHFKGAEQKILSMYPTFGSK